MPDPLKAAAIAASWLILIAGLFVLWTRVFSRAARARRLPPRLLRWEASPADILLLFLSGIGGGLAGSILVGVVGAVFGLTGDPLAITATAALHSGALLGILLFLFNYPTAAPRFTGATNILLSGLLTFLAAMPVVLVTNLAWTHLLKRLGYETDRQPAVEMLARLEGSPWLVVFILFAVVVAPATEELLFRAGLFRYFRGRISRPLALVLPALLFAAVHFHITSFVPLAVLGIIFSLGYERTGAIGTSIVAHALFNLNNLLMLLSGAIDGK